MGVVVLLLVAIVSLPVLNVVVIVFRGHVALLVRSGNGRRLQLIRARLQRERPVSLWGSSWCGWWAGGSPAV